MRRATGAAVLAILLVAGCVQDEPEEIATGVADEASNVSREALPDGRDGAFAAFNETNATQQGSGGLDHRHDMWGGKERDTLLEGRFGMAFLWPPGGGAVSRLRMPIDKLVWEGTDSVEVTLSDPQRRGCTNVYNRGERVCTDYQTGTSLPDPGSKVHLWYRDATATEWIDAGEIAWGKALILQITDPRQTDMPHATTTLWGFEVRSADTQDDSLTFTAKIDILRAPGDIPLWPGHPDFYADARSRLVYQGAARTKEDGNSALLAESATPLVYNHPDKLVSYGTRTVYVWANITRVVAPDPTSAPSGWFLEFHNASGRFNATDYNGLETSHAWVLHVSDAGMDSPYASASRWGFLLRAVFVVGQEPAEVLYCTGCSQYEVEYELAVVATDEELAPDAYDAHA